MSEVVVKGVSKSFMTAEGIPNRVLKVVSFEVTHGKVLSIVGANGSGKSTLLSLLSGMAEPDSGSITINGKPPQAAKIGFVWQNYRASLLPWLSVLDNIALPLKLQGVPRREREQLVRQQLDTYAVRLPLAERIYRLSGGQQQMACVMRALIIQPDILLLDEPTSALDVGSKWWLFDQVEAMRSRSTVTTVWVSHDPDEAVLAADKVMFLSGNYKGIFDYSENLCPRPRTTLMLECDEHLECRNQVLKFLLGHGRYAFDFEHTIHSI